MGSVAVPDRSKASNATEAAPATTEDESGHESRRQWGAGEYTMGTGPKVNP